MKTYDSANLAAISQRQIVQRDFLSITARNRLDGTQAIFSFWSDVGNVVANVYDADAGTVITRTFTGAGNLIAVTPLGYVSNLTVQDVTITLSALAGGAEQAIRGFEAKQGKVQMWRGWMSPSSRLLVAPAEPMMVGRVDSAEIRTGAEGEESAMVLTCKTDAQQLVRFNPDTRSDASQRRRSATDDFFRDVGTVGQWEMFWGAEQGSVA